MNLFSIDPLCIRRQTRTCVVWTQKMTINIQIFAWTDARSVTLYQHCQSLHLCLESRALKTIFFVFFILFAGAFRETLAVVHSARADRIPFRTFIAPLMFWRKMNSDLLLLFLAIFPSVCVWFVRPSLCSLLLPLLPLLRFTDVLWMRIFALLHELPCRHTLCLINIKWFFWVCLPSSLLSAFSTWPKVKHTSACCTYKQFAFGCNWNKNILLTILCMLCNQDAKALLARLEKRSPSPTFFSCRTLFAPNFTWPQMPPPLPLVLLGRLSWSFLFIRYKRSMTDFSDRFFVDPFNFFLLLLMHIFRFFCLTHTHIFAYLFGQEIDICILSSLLVFLAFRLFVHAHLNWLPVIISGCCLICPSVLRFFLFQCVCERVSECMCVYRCRLFWYP